MAIERPYNLMRMNPRVRRTNRILTLSTAYTRMNSIVNGKHPFIHGTPSPTKLTLLSLMQMSEIEREQILAERREQHQKLLDKMNLERLLKAQRRDQNSPEDDRVSSAAKRAFRC